MSAGCWALHGPHPPTRHATPPHPTQPPTTRRGVARLSATEAFLGQCLGTKAVGVRQREAEALRAKMGRVGGVATQSTCV
jgi:hypothetical protein